MPRIRLARHPRPTAVEPEDEAQGGLTGPTMPARKRGRPPGSRTAGVVGGGDAPAGRVDEARPGVGKTGEDGRSAVVPDRGAGRPVGRSGGKVDVLEAAEALKPLVAALGVERVKRLADLLG